MRTMTVSCLLWMVTMLAGCWPLAVNPLYDKDEGELLEGLVGTWRGEGDDATRYDFVLDPQRRGYDVTVINGDNRATTFKATVVRLGDATFLDAMAVWGQDSVPAWYGLNSMPLHAAFRLELTPDGELFLTPMLEEALAKRLENEPALIEHRLVEIVNTEGKTASRVMLTAPTAELRAFYQKHAKDVKLFAEPTKLKRARNDGM